MTGTEAPPTAAPYKPIVVEFLAGVGQRGYLYQVPNAEAEANTLRDLVQVALDSDPKNRVQGDLRDALEAEYESAPNVTVGDKAASFDDPLSKYADRAEERNAGETAYRHLAVRLVATQEGG